MTPTHIKIRIPINLSEWRINTQVKLSPSGYYIVWTNPEIGEKWYLASNSKWIKQDASIYPLAEIFYQSRELVNEILRKPPLPPTFLGF